MAADHGNVKVIAEDGQLQPEINNAGSKLVIVDFTAVWCGPCQRIAPVFARLSLKYSQAIFIKVDVDQCQETAEKHGVAAMPTFLFFKGRVKVDELRGADAKTLEEKITKWIGDDEGESSGVKGHIDLATFITKSGCECLNESDDHHLVDALTKGPGFLESDCDEQLLISIAFNQPVKLHSFKIQGPEDGRGPKTVKIFINQTKTMDFDSAEKFQSAQTLELTDENIEEDVIIPLRYVKFQNVQTLTLFVKDNQGGEETTVLNYLCIIGSPVDAATNMGDFKRVAGKKGESH